MHLEPDELMEKYKNWSPTQFDCKGLNADRFDIGEWYVLPVMQNRDSGILTRCNFNCAIEILGTEENEFIQVHRFNHWANGWFEIILISPDDIKTLEIAEEIISSLSNYPILDEMKYSQMENDEINDYWEHMSISERLDYIHEVDAFFLDARFDYIKDNRVYQLISDRLEVF